MSSHNKEPNQVRVVSYARYSCEDQNQLSVPDQFKRIGRHLEEQGIKPVQIFYESDEEMSGELLSRPGIDRVREMVRSRKVDLVVVEEISRLFRDRGEPHKFAGECVDHGVRLVAINDQFDTNNPGWQRDLSRAADEHASANDKTSMRIKRAYEGRWQDGYAMGPLVPGYKRRPVDAIRFERTRRGPFTDKKDERWTPTLKEMFDRVARGDPLRSVAEFLEREGLPKPVNRKTARWNERGVKSLVQNPIFKGQERYRRTFNKKHHASGRHIPEQSQPEQIMFRDMPHLAHVDALVWRQANDAISRRDRARNHPKGADNPNFRIPRESRSLLSNHFYCSVCGGKMIGQGRDGGGYRCAKALRGTCWNRATVSRGLTHTAILRAVTEALLGLTGVVDALVEQVQLLHAKDGDVARKLAELEQQITAADQRVGHCGEALLANPRSEFLSAKLTEAETRKAELVGQCETLKAQTQMSANPPSRQGVLDAIDLALQELADAGPEVGLLVRQLTTPVQAIPFQRIDCSLVVLRARFQVNLVAMLPSHCQQLIRGTEVDVSEVGGVTKEMTIDLFENPGPVKFAKEALSLHHEGCPDQEISKRLGTTRRTTYDAIRLAKLMEQRGVEEPYVRLIQMPASASRWRQRHNDDASLVA